MFDVIYGIIAAVFFLFIGYSPPWFTTKLPHFKSKRIQDLPGPFALPFFGTTWSFTIGKYRVTKIHEYYKEIRDKYGPILKEEALFNIPVISVYDKEDIEKVFRGTGKYPLRPPTEAIAKYRREHPERYASMGLVNEQGEKWHDLRTSLTTVLTSPKTIQSFLQDMDEIADDWCHLIKQNRDKDGNIFNLKDLAGRLGLEATCALVLGRRMGFLIEDQQCEIAQKLAESVHEHFIACRDTYYGLPLWKLFPTPAYKRLCKSENNIYELASELIRTADDYTKESAVFQSVLNAHIDEREKKSAIVDFLAAGIHTLKNSLLFLLYQIAMDPACQDQILEDNTKAYLKACSMETFRLSPTVNCLARITDTEVNLSGYHVPAGSVVILHTALACKNEAYFKDAQKFRPERWLNEEKHETAANATFLVTPFGYGKRICPGKRFIEQVLPIVIDKLTRHFKISANEPLELVFEFLLAPKGNVSMNFKDRYE